MRIYKDNIYHKFVSRRHAAVAGSAWSRRLAALLLGVPLLTACLPATAGVDGVIFPFAKYAQRPGLSSASGLKKHEAHAGADLFALASYKNWRFLGEYLLSDEEHDLERFEFGRRIGNNTLLWVGRYHSPASYWDILYHHAPFLQTSITRPQIVQYEDDGGVIPIHMWGVRADETITSAAGEWRFHAGVGAAPELRPGHMEALNALKPRLFGNRLMGVVMASYLPDPLGTNEAGVFASGAELPTHRTDVNQVHQVLAGGFLNWTRRKLHVNSAVFAVHDNVKPAAGSTRSHTFFSGYLQLEYKVAPHWIPYVRYEGSAGVNHDPYIELFSGGLPTTGFVGGLRFEVTQRQALTLEGARYELNGNHYSQLMAQWSGMFP